MKGDPMSVIDVAMVRGRVVGPPQYVKNDGKERCHFTIGLSAPVGRPLGAEITDAVQYFTVYAVTEESLVPRCRALLDREDEVLVFGDFGFHKGKLKMRVRDIALPEVSFEGIPTA
jgi:hypothetical protein